MGAKTFNGGVHPKDWKSFSKESKIEQLPLPKTVQIHMSQHIGKPAKPIVKVGSSVLTGELIGQIDGQISSNIHSSISGKVKKIDFYPNPSGIRGLAVDIESDEKDEWIELSDDKNFIDLPKDEIIKRIKAAGVCGMGGAGFPTHFKLLANDIDTLILNGVECEPYITSDYRLMVENPTEIVQGMLLFMKVLSVKNGFIGIEKNKPKAIAILKKEVRDIPNIKVVPLQLKYPQGAEKQLIYACTKRKVPNKGGLPSNVGVVVQNVGTALATYEAVRYKKPLIERIVTITGPIVRKPKNIKARIGTNLSVLLDFSGGVVDEIGKIISGGPMMGVAIPSSLVSISKTTSSMIFLDKSFINKKSEHTCIRCGRCIDVCPLNLLPSRMANASKYAMWKEADECGANDCMLCGCCSYVCPSHIQIVQWISIAREEL